MFEARVCGTRQATKIAARRLLSARADAARWRRRPAGKEVAVATAMYLDRAANAEILAHINYKVVELTTDEQRQRLFAFAPPRRPTLYVEVCVDVCTRTHTSLKPARSPTIGVLALNTLAEHPRCI